MNIDPPNKIEILEIKEKASFKLGNYKINIINYLGRFTPNIETFKVSIKPLEKLDKKEKIIEEDCQQLGLLRIGSLDSDLNRELELRKILNNYGLVAELLANDCFESVSVETTVHDLSNQSKEVDASLALTENDIENQLDDKNCLEEEYLPEVFCCDEFQESSEKLLLLTSFPSCEDSLENFLDNNFSQEVTLNLVIQLCQFCSYLADRKWILVNLVPSLIEFKGRLKLYDLTQIFPENLSLSIGLSSEYCSPELATGSPINSLMSSYTIGTLLYQILHHKLPNIQDDFDFSIEPIPRFYQLLKKLLSPIPEERLTIAKLRQLLLEARAEVSCQKIIWETASRSTIGLSLDRLQNEDNFGIKQHQLNDKETLIIGAIADGMGGMNKGEVASKIAIETVLREPIPSQFRSLDKRDTWLVHLFEKANQAIAAEIENGGTTLSVILGINEQLMIAHVGDSRIYFLREGKLQQISQDHSYVALLVNNGEITEEESRNHPERNMLLRSLGSKEPLRKGHVQNLRVTTNQLSLTLENEDILLLCSDGVWDLVSNQELQEFFTNSELSLQQAVDLIIQKVLEAGASDNATLLALQYRVLSS